MGRKRKTLTPEQVEHVERLAAVLTMDQIADFLGISEQTLRRRMKEDPKILARYKKGKQRAIAGVATNLIQQARNGNITAAIFYLKTQAGWRERDRPGDDARNQLDDIADALKNAEEPSTDRPLN